MKQPAEPTHTPQASQTVSLPLSHLPLPPLFILLRACCPGRAFLASRLPYASCVKPAVPTSASAPRPSAQKVFFCSVGLLQLGPRLIQFPCCIPNGQAWVFTLDLWTTFWAKQEGDRRWSFMSIWMFSFFFPFLLPCEEHHSSCAPTALQASPPWAASSSFNVSFVVRAFFKSSAKLARNLGISSAASLDFLQEDCSPSR